MGGGGGTLTPRSILSFCHALIGSFFAALLDRVLFSWTGFCRGKEHGLTFRAAAGNRAIKPSCLPSQVKQTGTWIWAFEIATHTTGRRRSPLLVVII